MANLFVGITITILIILILTSSVKVNILALKENQDSKVIINIKFLYGLIRFKKELGDFKLTTIKKESGDNNDEDLEIEMKNDSWTKYEGYDDFVNIRKKIEDIIKDFKCYKRVIYYLIDKTKFNTLLWKTEIGFEDAAVTGITTGIINIFKSNLFAILNNRKNKPKTIHLKITPNFNNEVLKTNIRCIFTVKIGYIIIAGLKYLWIKYIGFS